MSLSVGLRDQNPALNADTAAIVSGAGAAPQNATPTTEAATDLSILDQDQKLLAPASEATTASFPAPKHCSS